MSFTDNIKQITPSLNEIKSNTPVLIVNDKVLVNGIGGNFIPAGQGGGSMNFYKCASVGTGTWTGYLASIDSTTGIWSFSETATTGLTFDRLTPIVGSVYDQDCTFEVKKYKTNLPTDGLIFYLSLSDSVGSKDDTGAYDLTEVYTEYTFGTQNGIACLTTASSKRAKIIGPDMISLFPNNSSTRFTISFWAASQGSTETGAGFFYSTGNGYSCTPGILLTSNSIIPNYDGSPYSQQAADCTTMSFFVVTYNGTNIEYVMNGQRKAIKSTTTPLASYSHIYPGINCNNIASICAFRVYNRVLTSDEIETLAAEFTPTAS